MPHVRFTDLGLDAIVSAGDTVMDAARAAGAPLGCECCAPAACPACMVHVDTGADLLDPADDSERASVEATPDHTPTSRLACRARARHGDEISVRVAESSLAYWAAQASKQERLVVARRVRDHRRTRESRAVPVEAIDQLMESLQDCYGGPLPWRSLLDRDVAATHARRFKLDVSFALGPERFARFSVNDKGEPEAFRRRVDKQSAALGIPPELLESFFAISPAGEVQTTIGVKWRSGVPASDRVSLYFEELPDTPRGHQIRAQTLALAQMVAPAVQPGSRPNAVSVDVSNSQLACTKCYDLVTDPEQSAIPDALDRFRTHLPSHPDMGGTQFMLAHRFLPGGAPAGHKLLWMTEVHDPSVATWAWDHVARLRTNQDITANSATDQALSALRQTFSHRADVYLFPDLVVLNTNAAAQTTDLIVHVSVR